jgi:LAO/AO transport system kinase
MNAKKDIKRTLRTQEGVSQPPNINPNVTIDSGSKRRRKYSVDEYVAGIVSGNLAILSQAITLIESSLPEHYETAQTIIEKCLPFCSKSMRIGITGSPGSGKSTFIETFGLHIIEEGRKLAVLTIDPSSEQTKGSILGDKTRMEKLSVSPYAYIRPSPASGTLGGVARKTRETIILCESAGFSTIIVETVGVGQSETDVRSMVDCFVLLMLTGAGDELQGIKRGIMEMADLVAITKADGPNEMAAEGTKVTLQNALHLLPLKSSGWKPQVMTCSAINNKGIEDIWDLVLRYFEFTARSGYLEEQRKQQAVTRMHSTVTDYLRSSFYNNEEIKGLLPEFERQLLEGKLTSYKAAAALLDKYTK